METRMAVQQNAAGRMDIALELLGKKDQRSYR
jgi:hypothetical protein